MNSKSTYFVLIIFLVISFAIGFIALPYLPDNVANHWNAKGQVDGYSSKMNLILFTPILLAFLSLLLMLLPKIDPRRENIKKFQREYNIFIVFFAFFMFYVHSLTIGLNLGLNVNMVQGLVPIFAIMNFFIGYLCLKAQPNWFIGIRTPWTLSSDTVWFKTHQLGGKLFFIAGIITLLGLVIPDIAFYTMVIPLLFVALGLVLYSYVLFNQEKKHNG